MSKFLVTGGCGFIGSHTVEFLLKQNHEVRVLDNLSSGKLSNLDSFIKNSKLNVVIEDLNNREVLRDLLDDVDYVIHLAALADIVPSIKDPEKYFFSNVVGTFTLMQEARKSTNIKKIIYAASSSCYGIAKKYPTSETEVLSPEYPYALTKMLGEQILLHWGKVYQLPVVSLRLFNVYGPRARTSGTYGAVFGVFLAQNLANAPLTIVGDGEQSRDFTYVTDVVRAFYMASQSRLDGEILNVGSGGHYTINYLASLIGGKFTHIPERPGEPKVTFADIDKIKTLLNWSSEIGFEEGVKKVLASKEDWQDAPVWSPESIAEASKDWFKFLGKSNDRF